MIKAHASCRRDLLREASKRLNSIKWNESPSSCAIQPYKFTGCLIMPLEFKKYYTIVVNATIEPLEPVYKTRKGRMVGADKKSSRAEDFARYKQYDYMAVGYVLHIRQLQACMGL